MAEYIVIFIFAVISGIAQGVCGFGAGVIMMIILPYFFSISQSAGIAGLISMALIVLMVIRYRKHIRMKNVIPPVILYAAVSATAIHFSPMVDQVLLKRLFGAFLIFITLYHFFLDKKSSVKKWPVPVSIAAIIFSGACSGLFSVGGPLMVIYYMAHTDSKEEFLGTTEMLFMLNLILSTYLRIRNGIIVAAHIPYILVGIAAISIGFVLANKIVDKVDGRRLKNIVYAGVGISGILNLFGA